MDHKLVEAARVGDVIALHRILVEDPQILEKASLAHFAESPLHVAALAGKVDFVKELIRLMPSLATETNQQGLIPLHMAAAAGHVEIVKELLKVKLDEVNQCLLKDDNGWTPLHCAAVKGKINVMKELISYCPECAEEVTAEGETVLHLAVKANQFDVVEVLVDSIKSLHNFQTLLRAKDERGKTVYQLAAAKKQFRVLDKLKEVERGDIKEENCITVDVEGRDPEVSKKEEIKALQGPAAEREKDKSEFQNAVLVVATLIITLTYEGLQNPPSTLFKQGAEIDWGCVSTGFYDNHIIKTVKHCPANLALSFLTINTAIFLLSIYLVIRTLRGRRALTLRLLTVSLTLSYSTLLMAFSYYTAYFAYPLSLVFDIYILVEAKEDFIKAFRKFWGKFAKKEGERSTFWDRLAHWAHSVLLKGEGKRITENEFP